MQFERGLRRDERATQQSSNSWRWARNILINRGFKSASNEPGFVLDIVSRNGTPATSLPKPINGIIATGTSAVVFSVGGGSSEIGISINGVYTTIIDDPILNFSLDRPIEGVFKYNFNQQLIVSWWEGTSLTANTVKLLNLTVLPFAMNGFQLLNSADWILADLFGKAKYPVIDLVDIPQVGSLLSGKYQVIVGYETKAGATTGWSMPSNGVNIIDDPLTNGYTTTDGCPPGTITTSAIQVRVSNIDPAYDYVRIGIIKTIGGQTSAWEVSKYPITVDLLGNALDITYSITGNEVPISVPLLEAIAGRVVYPWAKTGTVESDRLHLGNLRTADSNFDFQKYANNIKVNWELSDWISCSANKGSYKEGIVEFYMKGFQSDEIYSFYLAFVKKDLTITPAYHIPGRRDVVPGPDSVAQLNPAADRYKLPASFVEENLVDPNIRKYQIQNTTDEFGKMGYWENKNEFYPTTPDFEVWNAGGLIDNIGGENVRHHKFPDLNSLLRWGYPSVKHYRNDGTYYDNGYPAYSYLGYIPNPFTHAGQVKPGAVWIDYTTPSLRYAEDAIGFNTSRWDAVRAFATGAFETYRFQFTPEAAPLPNITPISGTVGTENHSLNHWADEVTPNTTLQYTKFRFTHDQDIDYSFWFGFVFAKGNGALASNMSLDITLYDKNGVIRTVIKQDAWNGTFANASTSRVAGVHTWNPSVNGTFAGVKKGDYIIFDIRLFCDNGIGAPHIIPNSGIGATFHPTTVVIRTTSTMPIIAAPTTRAGTMALGIKLSDIYIPPAIESEIQGFVILYGTRTSSNLTVVGESVLLRDDWKDTTGVATGAPLAAHKYRFHDFATLRSHPAINPSYFKSEYAIGEAVHYDNNISQYVQDKYVNVETSIQSGISANAAVLPFNQANNKLIATGKVGKLSAFKYIPDGVLTSDLDNTNREEVEYLQFNNGFARPPYFVYYNSAWLLINSVTPVNTIIQTGMGTVHFGKLKEHKVDVYLPFNTQELSSTGKIHLTNGTNNYITPAIFGGDVFKTPHGNRIVDSAANTDYTLQYGITYNVVESPDHIAIRHDLGIAGQSYYPRGGTGVNSRRSVYLYNSDYSKINNTFPFSIRNPNRIPTNLFPHRVIRSIVSNSEEYQVSWNTFLAFDYYEMPKDKGEIWKLGVLNKELMINQKFAFHIARVKDLLATDSFKVYTGTGDIFDRHPDEVIPTSGGYAGCQSQWGAFSCKHGWVFADKSQGKIFAYNEGKINEISDDGLSIELFERLRDGQLIDNPFKGLGLSAGFDEEYNRAIFSNNGIDPFTLSFAFDIKSWGSNHDYLPNYIYNIREKLYSVHNKTNGEIYQHNIGANGKFYDGITYPSYMDIVFSDYKDLANIFDSVSWICDLEDNVTGATIRDKTITHIMIYNENQCSGLIDIRNANKNWFTKLSRNNEGIWSFNSFRDIINTPNTKILDKDGNLNPNILNVNTSWFNKNLFIEKLAIVRFFYDNSDLNTFYLMDADVNGSKSAR